MGASPLEGRERTGDEFELSWFVLRTPLLPVDEFVA